MGNRHIKNYEKGKVKESNLKVGGSSINIHISSDKKFSFGENVCVSSEIFNDENIYLYTDPGILNHNNCIRKDSNNTTDSASRIKDKKPIISNAKNKSNYRLTGVIGRGFYSKVFLGEFFSGLTKNLYAIKCLKKSVVIKKNYANCIFTEKNILTKLKGQNPFIIELKETFQDEKKLYLVFPYYQLDMFTLLNEIKTELKNNQNKNSFEYLYKFILAQIFLAISFLHENNILWRDLKPENVVIDTDTGYIKLIDFGLSKENVTDNSEIGELCGTNEYIPPEVIHGEKYNFNFDWWGFGIFMYEIFYIRPPFVGQSQKEIFDKIVNEPIPFDEERDSHVSLDAKDLISYLLSKDPDQRIKPEQIPYHPFFKEIDFDKIKNLAIESPINKIVKKIKFRNKLVFVDPLKKEDHTSVKVDQSVFKDF